MGKLIVYGIEASPPVRAVLLTLNALGLDYEFKVVDMANEEHLSKEYSKKNPQHTVPVLEDNGQYIWDSHAINAYLVRKFAKNDNLYPKEFYQRAIVDQRLHFDSGVFFAALRSAVYTILFKNDTSPVPQQKIDALYDALNFLEIFLEHDFIAGNTLTIADFSALSTATSLQVLAPLDSAKTPKVIAWINRLTKLPYYGKANGKGVAILDEFLKSKLGKN